MVVELEEAQEDWQFYSAQAPAQAVQNEVEQTLALLMELGAAKTTEPDFRRLIEQTRVAQQAEEWAMQRDRQEQENWLKDYE